MRKSARTRFSQYFVVRACELASFCSDGNKLSNFRSIIILRSGEGLNFFNENNPFNFNVFGEYTKKKKVKSRLSSRPRPQFQRSLISFISLVLDGQGSARKSSCK